VESQTQGIGRLTQDSETHALATLGASINRASGVLSAAGELYSNSDNLFHGGNAFAAHAITTAHTLLAEANSALAALYDAASSRAEQVAAGEAERLALVEALDAERARAESLAANHLIDEADDIADGDLAETEENAILTWKSAPESPHQSQVAASQDEFAKSYEELLRKVTAFEVFARHQDSDGSGEDNNLLPLVESLKEDLIKLSRVA
jgi:hypothetical protein